MPFSTLTQNIAISQTEAFYAIILTILAILDDPVNDLRNLFAMKWR
jgi:hypothetical protein